MKYRISNDTIILDMITNNDELKYIYASTILTYLKENELKFLDKTIRKILQNKLEQQKKKVTEFNLILKQEEVI